ncbi:hypothetical protein [Streptomyces beihaiensis]|uniref:Uncharacterized protein n=1 Tax=Streptomyces beihaiensis TaxID=2984495 RepID=A0ABT3U390_9ACTN|nr:hypothetical protein [Streptomyces beihaiensis]MCX3063768.1 hypothetical protein [Streptomyces beihaiensis]
MSAYDEENSAVKGLLERAVADVARPYRNSEEIFMQARRRSWRRRAAMTGAAAAAVAAVSAMVPALASGRSEEPAAAPTASVQASTGLVGLLPTGIGEVKQVPLIQLVKGVSGQEPKPHGPYDGAYAVRKDGGVGLLESRTASSKQTATKGSAHNAKEVCASLESTPGLAKGCTAEAVTGGGSLAVWYQPNAEAGGSIDWSGEYDARLFLPDGRSVHVRNVAGWTGTGSLGAPLAAPPLTRNQLHEVMLRMTR